MTYDQKKALTNTTAMTPQSNFDWEPNIVSASSTYNSDEGQRPQRSMRGDVFLKYVFPEHWTADGMPATGRILLLHDIHYVVLRWPTDEEKSRRA